MIKAGVLFCPYCGQIDDKAYYMSAIRADVGVYLHYKRNTYSISAHSTDPDDTNLPEVTLHAVDSSTDDGMPYWIEVLFEGSDQPTRLRRHCPHCAKQVFLPSYGKYPTFVVAMVGNRSSGKSAYLNSISFPANPKAILDIPYPYMIDIQKFATSRRKAEPTEITGRGMTKVLSILDRKSNKTVAHVLLLDVSGELYLPKNQNSQNLSDPDQIWKLLTGSGEYTGADAFIFVERIPMRTEQKSVSLEFDSAEIAQRCIDENAFGNKPLAYVYTHLDRAIEDNDLPVFRNVSREIPLMTRHTFFNNSYDPERLINRIYVEDSIASSFNPYLLTMRPKSNTRGFLVQSCSTSTIDNKPVENYDDRLNVLDPLLWILNKLRLFPLYTEDDI